MPFKIIEIYERGKGKLSIIPSGWEKDGNLSWPTKNLSWKSMVKKENSKPLQDWTTMLCTVKRSSIATYNKAEEELNVMLCHSDTSDYPDDERVNEKERKVNYNAMAANLILNQHGTQENSVTAETTETTETNVIEILTDNYIPPNKFDQLIENQKQILNNQKCIMDNQSLIHETQNLVLEKEDKNYRQMLNLTVQIDDSFKRLSNQNLPVVKLNEANPIELEAFMLKPISNANELYQLENNLTDKMHKQKLHLQYSLLCNKSYGSGITCAYKLLDILFTREFLCQCSRSGGSKGETVKIALKCCKNILNFFFGLINKWDASYTYDTNEKFFKTVLKNSGKRLETKNLRTSTKRSRKDPSTTNKKQKNAPAEKVEKRGSPNKIKETNENRVEEVIIEEIIADIKPSSDVEETEISIETSKAIEEDEEESLC